MRHLRFLVGMICVMWAAAGLAQADDWPQWLGPRGASEWHEEGIRESLPAGGLTHKWRVDCSYGYSGPVVAGGKVYLFDYEVTSGEVVNLASRRERLKGRERVHCIDAETGKVLCTDASEVEYYVSYPGGPRATPAVDGDRIYTLGTEGDLTCRDTATGTPVWHVNFKERFGTVTPIWGHASCPLVEGDVVVCMVGGEGSGMVAFDKRSGETVWKALSLDEPGYCAPMVVELVGVRQVVAFHPLGATALDPKSGETRWEAEMRPSFSMSTAPPRQLGDRLFVSSYGNSMMLQLESPTEVKVLWRGKPRNSVNTSNSVAYFTEEAIYGCDAESAELVAVDPGTAGRLWATTRPVVGEDAGRNVRHGTAFIVRHIPSGRYFLFNERGELIVAELTPGGYEEVGRAKLLEPTNEAFGRPVLWSHPAFAQKSVFVRNDKELVCVDLEAE